MKVLFKSFYLYFLGVCADYYRKSLERAVERSIRKGGTVSSKRLIKMSERSYRLYKCFKAAEADIKREFNLKAV